MLIAVLKRNFRVLFTIIFGTLSYPIEVAIFHAVKEFCDSTTNGLCGCVFASV